MDNKGSWCQIWGPNDKAMAFNPLEPTVDMVNIASIARALSNQCRFNGHVRTFFSVAQHSVMVSMFCDELDALWGLLHDASEAYIVDIPRPLKKAAAFSGYMGLEAKVMEVVCEKFGLDKKMPDSVAEADDLILQWEFRDNLQPKITEIFTDLRGDLNDNYAPLQYLTPEESEREFLHRFYTLINRGRP
jgi:5'-deoxynucleotidase YfbR-like HD superfamily hydrolase